MSNFSSIGRIAAAAAVVGAVVLVAVVLLMSGSDYQVKAMFQNAGQLVKGDQVEVSGRAVGIVKKISLSPDGQAQISMVIMPDSAPLREGTVARVRQASLSGIANRYVELSLAPNAASKIPNGGVIDAAHTVSAVDLDQIFNTLGPTERDAIRSVLRGSGSQFAGRGTQAQANEGFRYLNPYIASNSALFREVNRNPADLRRFLGESSRLVTDIASRHTALTGLVNNLATTTGALARRKAALADAISQLPPFMRRANSTFVDLRATLGDLTPLVNESKPVAKKLRPFLATLRSTAANARPTIRDLAAIIQAPGPNNDLIDLTRSNIPVERVALEPVRANGRVREGAFPAATKALAGGTPELAFARPYAPDLTGWFDDFSHTGLGDANGNSSRVQIKANPFFSVQAGAAPGTLPQQILRQAQNQFSGAVASQNNRCPGTAERNPGDNSTPFTPDAGIPGGCNPTQVPPGP